MLPDPVPRGGERALARFGLLGEGAVPVFTAGARYPLAGLLLALPALAGTGLLETARSTYGRLKDGFYGLETMLVLLVFLALLREPRAEGATRVPRPRWAGCWAWTGRRRSRRSAASSPGSPGRPGRGLAAGHRPPPRRGEAGHARLLVHRRAHPRLLRHPGRAEDARRPAEVPRPGDRGDLGHR